MLGFCCLCQSSLLVEGAGKTSGIQPGVALMSIPPPAWGRNLQKQETPASCLASQCANWQQGQRQGGQGTLDTHWAPAGAGGWAGNEPGTEMLFPGFCCCQRLSWNSKQQSTAQLGSCCCRLGSGQPQCHPSSGGSTGSVPWVGISHPHPLILMALTLHTCNPSPSFGGWHI